MTRQEQQAWGLVGFGAVIIILLLLDFGTNQKTTNVTTGPVEFPPFDPITFNLTTVPPNGYPFTLDIGAVPNVTNNITVAGQPCSCGCNGGVLTVGGLDLSTQIQQLNSAIQNSTIQFAQQFYAGYPVWATNNTQIAAFNNAVGLPPPF